jgi:hypothetical protein
VERYREREAHFAKALHVADGGQYRADWDGAIERVLRERDEALDRAAKSEAALRSAREEGRREGIEEAARICDGSADGWTDRQRRHRDFLLLQAADRIRALSPSQQSSPYEAGICTDCRGPVYHRPGKPGEFDHECAPPPHEDGGSPTPPEKETADE